MKELHNHIFSNTTCISKETMLKFINKQLPKQELHEVEKHMLDCELCSDAYAGMQYAQNSSVLFALDNAIDQKVGGASTKAPVLHSLMVAASVLIILFGGYFSLDYFNKTVVAGEGLAVNNETSEERNEFVLENVEENEYFAPNEEEGEEAAEKAMVTEESLEESKKYKSLAEQPEPESVEQVEIVRVENIVVAEDVEIEEWAGEIVAEEVAFMADEMADAVPEEELEIRSVSNSSVVLESIKKDEDVSSKVKSDKKRKAYSAKKSARSEMDLSATAPVKFKDELKSSMNMLTISGHKVYDYREEYEADQTKNKANNYVTESVSAGFESKEEKVLANKELEETTVEITYKDALENAIKLYKNKKYQRALQEFDIILIKHPEDVNAQFYSGLSYYYQQKNNLAINKFDQVLINRQTEFNEETRWFKALALINSNNIDKAKQLLKSIFDSNGFYKDKAEAKLVQLN